MGVMESFSERLKELREEKGISQTELGDELGVSRSSISFYEKAERIPDIELLAKAAAFFSVPVDYLLGLSNAKSTNEPELKAICDYTGLNEHSVCALHDLSQKTPGYEIDFLNAALEFETRFYTSLLSDISTYKRIFVVFYETIIGLKEEIEDLKIDVKQCEDNAERENILASAAKELEKITADVKRICRMYRYDCIESFSDVLDFYVHDIARKLNKYFSDCENEIIEIKNLVGELNGNDNEEE